MKKISLLLLLFTLFTAPSLFGEVLSLPPLKTDPVFGQWKFAPAVQAWATGKRHLTTGSSMNHSWDYEVGVDLSVFTSPYVMGYFKARMMLLSEVHPIDPNYIHPLMVVPGFWFGLTGQYEWIQLSAEFSHDCKHNTDRPANRIAVHDLISFRLSHKPLTWTYPGTSLTGWTKASIGGEIGISAVFQPHDLEINKGALSAQIYLEPLRWDPWISLFVHAQWKGFFRKQLPFFQNVTDFDQDFTIQAGAAFPDPQRGVSLYVQWERLTDNLIDYSLETELLPSIGLLLNFTM